jgi:hypothetical protein
MCKARTLTLQPALELRLLVLQVPWGPIQGRNIHFNKEYKQK